MDEMNFNLLESLAVLKPMLCWIFSLEYTCWLFGQIFDESQLMALQLSIEDELTNITILVFLQNPQSNSELTSFRKITRRRNRHCPRTERIGQANGSERTNCDFVNELCRKSSLLTMSSNNLKMKLSHFFSYTLTESKEIDPETTIVIISTSCWIVSGKVKLSISRKTLLYLWTGGNHQI